MGTSCFLLSPLHHSLFPSSSSSSSLSSSQSFLLYSSYSRNGGNSRKKRTAMACMRHGSPNESFECKRRAILFVGISVLPFLDLRARAFEDLATRRERKRRGRIKESETRGTRGFEAPKEMTSEDTGKAEKARQGDASPNPILSLLNGIGIISSGVFGALYALAQKEKTATEAALESVNTKLKDKEVAIVSLEKNFKIKLLNEQEDRKKQLEKANEEQLRLLNHVKSANSTITSLGKELQSEKKLVEEFKIQMDDLQNSHATASKEKKELEEKLIEKVGVIEVLQEKSNLLSSEIKEKEDNIRKLNSIIHEKELELKKLKSVYEQTKKELAEANSEIKALKNELLKNEKELEFKNGVVDDLNARASSLTFERDDSNRKFDAIQKEYSDLKLSSEKKAASDSKLLGEKEQELRGLKEQLELALNEVSKSQVIVSDMYQERDNLRKLLDIELKNVENMKHELEITYENLGKSRNEVSDLGKKLKESKNLCLELEAEVSKVKSEFEEAKKLFHTSLDEAKQSGEVLAKELNSVKEDLKKTENELKVVSQELEKATENRDSLKKELVDVYKKAESATRDLKEEKKTVSSLNKELQVFGNQISKDKEWRKSLERDLEEATKSLDEMNRNALILSRELEVANTRNSSLQEEKEVIYESLLDQKRVSQETRENLEDAHDMVMRLGKERENLLKKGKKMDEELGSAKGEILRLRSQINSSRTVVNDKHQQKGELEENVVVPAKKITRRRKTGNQVEKS